VTVERVVAKLKRDAAREAEAILGQARERAAEITAEGKRRADEVRRTIVSRAAREAELVGQRIRTAARLEARTLVARARAEAVESAFQGAREALAELEPDRRGKLCLEALLALGERTGEVVLSPRDREEFGPWLVEEANAKLGGSLVLAEEARPLLGGFVLKTGQVETIVSLDETLDRLREELEPSVAAVLFAQEED
jgi:V/A-type H+-transporting ATPase subunit E